jgi:hypothetical protein
MIRDIGDRESAVLKEARSTNEPSHGQVPLWSRDLCPKEATHHGARQHIQLMGELLHRHDARRADK